jgi:acyl-CoA synthetase (AMP-forming)/AMP-acid ligase II
MANGYIGKLLPEQEVKIVNDEGKELPSGEIGEMLFKGTQTINEYFNMPEENKATFTEDGWCKSGDLGYISKDGGLYIKGRKKFIIRVGGYTVLPSEVEEIAVQHPNVAMAAAIGFPDKIYGDAIWLAIVTEVGKEVDENEIIELCKQQLADFKVPKKIMFEKELPITRLGKLDRPGLKKKYVDSMK